MALSGREAILARVRARLRVDADAGRRTAVEAHLDAHTRNPQPAVPSDLLAAFSDRATRLASSVARVDAMAQVPDAVARHLAEQGLPRRAVGWPALSGLEWTAAGLGVEFRAARGDDAVGVTGAFCGIAETGTLVLLSGAETPGSASLLPETHVAIVARERIVAAMEDAWALLRSERDALPRAVNFVSGPSRTADIEQTVTLGAHGPARVHIVIVG